MQLPSTKGGRLIKELIKMESTLARMSGYCVKYVEKSGTQLARLFPRVFTPPKCHWPECPTCENTEEVKMSKCRVSNIVYEAVCVDCEAVNVGDNASKRISKYIGESSRTLAERSKEHVEGALNCEYDNFIVKHWVTSHCDLTKPPRMKFKVLKSFQDALSRLATESVLIEMVGTMNSKSEFRNNKISRIIIEDPRKKKDRTSEDDEK